MVGKAGTTELKWDLEDAWERCHFTQRNMEKVIAHSIYRNKFGKARTEPSLSASPPRAGMESYSHIWHL